MYKYAEYKPEREYWNVMKGIGIICIVIGHSWMDVQNFVYLFHVPLFYLIAGYLYNEEKYGNNFWVLVQSKLRLWLKYILVYTPFVLLHNFFGYCCVAEKNQPYYDRKMIAEQLCHVMIGDGNEFLPGPLWFVPSMIIAICIMGGIIRFSTIIRGKTGSVLISLLFELVVVIIITGLGYYMILNKWVLTSKMQITFIAMIYVWIGRICARYALVLKKFMSGYAALLLAIILWIYSRNHLYSLVDGFISLEMFLIACLGFYMCACFAHDIVANRYLYIIKKIISLIGRASFWIMTMHFGIIRYIDRVYAWRKGDVSMMFEHYLGSHRGLVPLYLLLGIGIPTLMYYCIVDRRQNDYAK